MDLWILKLFLGLGMSLWLEPKGESQRDLGLRIRPGKLISVTSYEVKSQQRAETIQCFDKSATCTVIYLLGGNPGCVLAAWNCSLEAKIGRLEKLSQRKV